MPETAQNTASEAGNDRIIPSEAPRSVATYTLLSNGVELTRTYQVLSVLVQRELNRIPFATLVLIDGDPAAETFAVSNSTDFEPGKTLEIRLGYRSQEETIFKGLVVKHGIKLRERHSVLVVECRDAAVKMTVSPVNKYRRDLTDSSLIEELISSHGLEADVEDSGFTHKELVQYNATDWDFMLCRAEANGMLVAANDGKVIVKKPDLQAESVLNIQFGATVFDMDLEMDARYQFEKVTATAWNPADGEMRSGIEAAEPQTPTAGNLEADTLAAITGQEGFALLHNGNLQQEELQQWADGKLLQTRLAKIRGKVTTEGTAAVQLGQFIELRGAGERFEGKLFVSGIRQHFQTGIWKTTFQLGLDPESFAQSFQIEQPKAGGLLPAIQGLQIGIVTDLEDPDGQNRIKLRLPVLDAADEGIWARLGTLDAGKERGSFFLPEIDDEVVVGFLDNDPRHAVILGMLHSAHHAAPLTAANANPEKGYVSRSEIKLLINDEKKTIGIETPAGNKILLTEEDTAIRIEDQNGNTLVLDQNGIKMESSKDINLSATGNYSISDSAGNSIRIDSGGVNIAGASKLVLQGAQIEITAAQLSVNTPMAQFNGVLQTNTMIATMVVGTTYTPGAGNLY